MVVIKVARYIDADKIPYFHYSGDDTAAEGVDYTLKGVIESRVPTEDVAPVVHAYWIETANTWTHDYYEANNRVYRCSKCGRVEKIQEPFCNCGAKMDGKVDDKNG